MKKAIFLSVMITSILVFLLVLKGIQTKDENLKMEDKNNITSLTFYSWTYGYGSIHEITKASDFIAIIYVKDMNEGDEKDTLSFPVFNAKVIEPIYGCQEDDMISIVTTLNMKDDPPLELKKEYLIFTQKNEDGTYSILGGPQGRMQYENGKLTSMLVINKQNKEEQQDIQENLDGNHDDENKELDLNIKNKDAKSVIRQIKESLKN